MNYPTVRDSLGVLSYERPAFDAAAETAVIAAVQARADADLVYSFKQGDGLVTELTIYGVFETARELNQRGFSRIAISDRPPVVDETDEYIEVRYYARDELSGSGHWGVKRQDKLRNGRPIPFATELAHEKAQRNAMRKLIPSALAKAMIEHRLKAAGQRATVRDDTTGRQVSARTRAQLGAGGSQNEEPDETAETFIDASRRAIATAIKNAPGEREKLASDADSAKIAKAFTALLPESERAHVALRALLQRPAATFKSIFVPEAKVIAPRIAHPLFPAALTVLVADYDRLQQAEEGPDIPEGDDETADF